MPAWNAQRTKMRSDRSAAPLFPSPRTGVVTAIPSDDAERGGRDGKVSWRASAYNVRQHALAAPTIRGGLLQRQAAKTNSEGSSSAARPVSFACLVVGWSAVISILNNRGNEFDYTVIDDTCVSVRTGPTECTLERNPGTPAQVSSHQNSANISFNLALTGSSAQC